jgi:outer membrane receptor protein involved in Fe transport
VRFALRLAVFLKRAILRAFIALPIFVFAIMHSVSPALAQTPTGTLTGTVVDVAGKALGGVRVTVASAASSTTVRTAADGTFSVRVAPDTYTVSAAESGFQTGQQEGVTVLAGQTTTLKFSLGNATLQTIGSSVVSRATSLNTSAAARQTVSSQTFLDQGQAQVVNVLDQIPGVNITRESSNEPGANSSISIRGAQPYESQVLIDGHPVVTSANGADGFNSTFVNSLLLGDVEINEGPGSLPNTIEDAVGGTLNFRTPSITGGPSGSAVVGYDSFNGNYYAFKASDTFGKLGILVGLANYETPGYLTPQDLYGGAVYPKVTAGTAFDPHVGVVDYGYHATSNFSSFSQLAKLSYSFSPQTSILLTQYSTQNNDDETGTNDQFVDATIVPCIQKVPAGGTSPLCTAGGSGQNYTAATNTSQIGQVVPINLYAPYPNTGQFDNEPIYSAELRTSIGPGSFLARYYTGSINRVITQTFAPYANIPCSSPACPNGDNLTVSPPVYNSYYGEPYVEDTIDILHGLDGQYTVPFGNNSVTAGFDRHVDTATFGEFDPTEGPPTFPQNISVQSLAYSLRGTFALTPKLTLNSGNYLSSTTYVGTRFDPRDGLVYRVNPNVVVRASYGSAYVAPYYDLLNPTTHVTSGTLDLATTNFKPETSSGYDLGGDVKLGRDTIFKADAFLTNIFNRYAEVSTQTSGTFGGKPYTMVEQNGNQAVVRNEGVEVQLLRAPKIGLGYQGALDLLRDYAYDQTATGISVNSIFSATPGNYVQLPTYPYFKLRNDLFYSFGDGSQARFSATSYGENNSFGEPGFTEFDGEIRVPLKLGLILNVGGTNLFNHDDYQAGGVYDGGPTFQTLGGGISYTTQFFAQPRTLYIQLQRSVGPSGTINPSRTSL